MKAGQIGTWIGVQILSGMDEKTLLIFVGIAVITFAILQSSSYKLHLRDNMIRPAGVFFGGASGLIGGICSFFGPMLIVYLISIPRLGKNEFTSTISFLYVSAVVPWAITLYVFGILDERLLIYSTCGVVPVMLGQTLGRRLRERISEDRFKYLIIGILVISGISMLWRAYH